MKHVVYIDGVEYSPCSAIKHIKDLMSKVECGEYLQTLLDQIVQDSKNLKNIIN